MAVTQDDPSQDVIPLSVRSWALRGQALESLRIACIARDWGELDLAREAKIGKTSASRILAGKSVSRSIIQRVATAIDESRPKRGAMRLLLGELDER